MDSWTRVYLGSLLVVLGLLGVSPAQNAEESLPALSDEFDVSMEDEIAIGIETLNETDQPAIEPLDEVVAYTVHLRDDGMLHGRVRIAYPTGKNVAAAGQVHFKQNGEMVDSVATDAEGAFEVAGLSPGDYFATAEVEGGMADFGVNVLAYEEGAGPHLMTLEAMLSPPPELKALPCDEEIIYEELLPTDMGCGMSCDGGFSGGCGGGCGASGGRGLGWLLGAGALAAGITALATDENHKLVSPSAP